MPTFDLGNCCAMPMLIHSGAVEQQGTGVVQRCTICEYCGRWRVFADVPATALLSRRTVLVGAGRYPHRKPAPIFRFPVRIPWKDIESRVNAESKAKQRQEARPRAGEGYESDPPPREPL